MNSFLLFATLNLGLGGMVFLLGVIILRENPRQKLNLVVSLMLFFSSLGSILGALGFLAARSGGLTEDSLISPDFYRNFAYLWEFFFPSLLLFASVYPEERDFTRRFPGFAVLVFVPYVFHFVLLVTVGWFIPEGGPTFSVTGFFQPVFQVLNLVVTVFLSIHQALFSLVNLSYGFAAAFLLIASHRHASDRRIRQQIRVIGAGLTTCLLAYSLATSVPTLLNIELNDLLAGVLTTIALISASGAIAYSIVRHKFLDTKLLARRAILYAISTGFLVGFYLLVVVRLNTFFTRLSGVKTEVFEPVLLILALILFQPAVSRLEEALEGFFLRDPADYRNVLRHLGREILTTIDLDLLLARSIRTIAETLSLRSAYIVAFSRSGPLIHIGRGLAVPGEDVDRLPEVLGTLPATRESFRIGDGDLAPEDRTFLESRFDVRLLLPLRTHGEMVGALLLGPKITETVYTSEDVTLLTTLAEQMSVSLQNGLLLRDRVAVARFEEELNLARQIQRSFLPSSFPALRRLDIHATAIPSKEVGGDLYDLVQVGLGEYFLAIGDVSGKGVPAALLSSMLQASLRTQARSRASVAGILGRINSLVYKSTTSSQFATFFLAHVCDDELKLSFSNAGHNYPLLIRRDGTTQDLERGGLILGILDDVAFEEAAVPLDTGDRLVLFTDGVSEAQNERDEEFGEERLAELVRGLPPELSAEEVTGRILETLYGFLGDREAQDDITVMVVQVLAPEPSPEETIRVEPGVRSAIS